MREQTQSNSPANSPEATAAHDAELTEETGLTTSDRKSGSRIFMFFGIALLIAITVSAIVFRSWMIFGAGVVGITAYGFFVMAPVWLAESSRAAEKAKPGGTVE